MLTSSNFERKSLTKDRPNLSKQRITRSLPLAPASLIPGSVTYIQRLGGKFMRPTRRLSSANLECGQDIAAWTVLSIAERALLRQRVDSNFLFSLSAIWSDTSRRIDL